MNSFRQFAPRVKTRLAGMAAAVAMAFAPLPGQAAEHPLTRVNYDAARNVNVIDVVMSLDWDFDNPPPGRDKAYLEDILKQSSQSLFTMTEGKQMLGKVYVYKNKQFIDNTDIQYLVENGRANAHIAGIGNCKSCRVLMFAGTNETAVDQGKTVAHEFGHYMHGIYDEYREEGSTSTEAGSPQDGDTPKDSMMHDHLKFPNLSTPADYVDEATRKTAHFRVFGRSAWETLVSDPSTDPTPVGRMYFDPFRNMTAPASPDALTRPTTGWENDLKVVYMGADGADSRSRTAPGLGGTSGPINVIVIDTTVSAPHLAAQLNAAQQVINASGDGGRVAVFAHPYSSKAVLPLTALRTAADRTVAKAAVARVVAADATDATNAGDRLFDWAESILPELFPRGPASATAAPYYYRLYSTGQALGVADGQVIYYDGANLKPIGPVSQWLPQSRSDLSGTLNQALAAVNAVRTDADTPVITLFTTESQTVSNSVSAAYRDAKVAVNPVVLVTPERAKRRFTASRNGDVSLFDLAENTRGVFKEAIKAADLARAATQSANSAEGDDYEMVADGYADLLEVGQKSSLQSLIAGNGLDGEILFQVFWSDGDEDKINFTLTTPAGLQITPQSLPAGVSFEKDSGEGMAIYTVSTAYANRGGKWTSTVSASAATSDYVFQEVAVKSSLSAITDIFGGTREDRRPMHAVTELSGPLPVAGASVVADIFNPDDGNLIQEGLRFKDDGVAPDDKAGDGRYTANLSNLPVGDYEIVVKASGDGSAVFTTAGSTKKGQNATPVKVPAFERMAVESFKKEL